MKPSHPFFKVAWKIVFTIFYPIITAFSLLMMWIIALLSDVSSLIVTLAKRIYPEDNANQK